MEWSAIRHAFWLFLLGKRSTDVFAREQWTGIQDNICVLCHDHIFLYEDTRNNPHPPIFVNGESIVLRTLQTVLVKTLFPQAGSSLPCRSLFLAWLRGNRGVLAMRLSFNFVSVGREGREGMYTTMWFIPAGPQSCKKKYLFYNQFPSYCFLLKI